MQIERMRVVAATVTRVAKQSDQFFSTTGQKVRHDKPPLLTQDEINSKHLVTGMTARDPEMASASPPSEVRNHHDEPRGQH